MSYAPPHKICRDCKYHYNMDGDDVCQHPNAVDIVTGRSDLLCKSVRQSGIHCGMEGSWFRANTDRFDNPPRPDASLPKDQAT